MSREQTEHRHWHIVTYDIRDPGRWRRVYRLLNGHGSRLQYSVFRVRATPRELERLRCDLQQTLASEDDLLVISLCSKCGARVDLQNSREQWPPEPAIGFSE